MFNHGLSLGVEYIFDTVVSINDGHVKEVILSNQTLKTKVVIIATGAEPRRLGLPNEDRLASRGISWCAICDGPIYKGKDVIVIGGGNSAVEEGSYLATLANSVVVVQNLAHFTADKKAIEVLEKHQNVKTHFNSIVTEFLVNEDGSLKGVKIRTNNEEEQTILADGVFEYVGLKPTTEGFEHLGILGENKCIITNEKMETNKPGIYAVGDVRDKQIRQVVTATSDGAIAVQNALKYIETWD